MSKKIFVNLPVKDLDKSVAFFTHLGYTFNPQFTDETATCMIISDDIYAMLLTEAKFATFTNKSIVDAKKATEVLICLSADSREDVDQTMGKVLEAGGKECGEAKDYGFMYYRAFEDIDGHIWELAFMQEDTPS